MILRDQALQEFRELTETQVPELEQKFSYQDSNLSSLSSDIWQTLDKASNLCMLLWNLKLEQEAGKLENLKIYLRQMHRELASEIKGDQQ